MAEKQTSLEDIQLDIEAKICGFSVEKLSEIAGFLKVDVSGEKPKGRLSITKKLRETLETLVIEHENKVEFLQSVLDFISQGIVEKTAANDEVSVAATAQYEQAKKDYEDLQEKFKIMMESQAKLLAEAEEKTNTKKQTTTAAMPLSAENMHDVYNLVLKREFKISGTIGGEHQKDSLSFVGLIRQIDSGLEKGYKEREIIEAVVRAVYSGSKLKSYLEMMTDITLQKLRQILRVHYQEKSGTELYQELTTMVQGSTESPQDFLLRALSLRERVVFASKAEGAVMKYQPELVQSLFIHAIETGLRDEVIRNKVRPVLQKSGVTDEEVMETLNKIVSVEGERKSKLGSHTIKVSNLGATPTNNGEEQNPKSKPAKASQPFNLKATLEAVQADLAELKATVHATQVVGQTIQTNRTQRRAVCRSCEEAKRDRCDHCFKCGSSDHFARGCKATRPPGNGRQLRPRDRE